MAAKRTVCVFAEMNLARSGPTGVSWRPVILLALLSYFSPALIQAGDAGLEEKTVAHHEDYLFHANLDLISLTEKIDQITPDENAPTQAARNYVIDRIEFPGNPPIRADTLK